MTNINPPPEPEEIYDQLRCAITRPNRKPCYQYFKTHYDCLMYARAYSQMNSRPVTIEGHKGQYWHTVETIESDWYDKEVHRLEKQIKELRKENQRLSKYERPCPKCKGEKIHINDDWVVPTWVDCKTCSGKGYKPIVRIPEWLVVILLKIYNMPKLADYGTACNKILISQDTDAEIELPDLLIIRLPDGDWELQEGK